MSPSPAKLLVDRPVVATGEVGEQHVHGDRVTGRGSSAGLRMPLEEQLELELESARLDDDLFQLLVAVRRRQARLDPVHARASVVDQIRTAALGPLDAGELARLEVVLVEADRLAGLLGRCRRALTPVSKDDVRPAPHRIGSDEVETTLAESYRLRELVRDLLARLDG